MKTTLKSLLAAVLVTVGSASGFGQAISLPDIALLEGTVSAVSPVNAAGNVTLTVMGARVLVRPGVPVTTPTATLTLAQLTSTATLPGRTQAGFVGGTAIVQGTWNAVTASVDATEVFIEPAENILLGVVTANGAAGLFINGVPISPLPTTEARMPSIPTRTAEGIEIFTASIPVGTPASAEGYFVAGKFYSFFIEADRGTPVSQLPQVTIARAQVRERTPNNQRGDEVEVRGAVTTTHTTGTVNQTVRVFRVDTINGVRTETSLGTAVAVPDPLTPGVATYTFRVTTPTTTNAVLGTAPSRVKVVNISITANPPSIEAATEVL